MSYRNDLIVYVMKHGGKGVFEVEWYLDEYCPQWRDENPPTTNKIEVEKENDDESE